MGGKITHFTGEVLYSIPNSYREVKVEYKKSAEVVVVKRGGENQKERRTELFSPLKK